MSVTYRAFVYKCDCGNIFAGGWDAPFESNMDYYECPKCDLMAPREFLGASAKSKAKDQFMGEDMFLMRNPVKTFRKGGKETLDSKRKVNEYAKANDLVYGGDDLDQEADHNYNNKIDGQAHMLAEAMMDRLGG